MALLRADIINKDLVENVLKKAEVNVAFSVPADAIF